MTPIGVCLSRMECVANSKSATLQVYLRELKYQFGSETAVLLPASPGDVGIGGGSFWSRGTRTCP
jgi:hypothetical protein